MCQSLKLTTTHQKITALAISDDNKYLCVGLKGDPYKEIPCKVKFFYLNVIDWAPLFSFYKSPEMILNDIMTKRMTTIHYPSKSAHQAPSRLQSGADLIAQEGSPDGVDLSEPQFRINFMNMTPDDTWLILLVKKVSDYMSDRNESYICAYDLCMGNKHPPLVKYIESCNATTAVYTCKNPEDPKEIFLFTVNEKGTVRRYSLPSFDLVREYNNLHQDFVLNILGNGEYVIMGGSRGNLTAIEIKSGNIICQSKKVTSHA